MKRPVISLVLICLTSMVFAVTYPSRPYKNTNSQNRNDSEILVPIRNDFPEHKVSVHNVSAQPVVAQSTSFAAGLTATSDGSVHSYGGGTSYAGGATAKKSSATAYKSAGSGSITMLKTWNDKPNTGVGQLASTTFDSHPDVAYTYRGDPPGTGGQTDPNNPEIWVPVGDGIGCLLLMALAYLLIISVSKVRFAYKKRD